MSTSAAREQRRAARPRRPRTSGTSGTSQIRNCGESTLPSATNATTAAAQSQDEPVAAGRAAREQDPDGDERGRLEHDCAAASTSGADPARFCEPWLDSTVSPSPNTWCGDEEQARAEALDLERPRGWPSRLCQTPPGARTRNGSEDGGDDPGEHGRADERLAPAPRRQT